LAKRRYLGIVTTTNYSDLLTDGRIDAIGIATPAQGKIRHATADEGPRT
jgi:hypothetical protein